MRSIIASTLLVVTAPAFAAETAPASPPAQASAAVQYSVEDTQLSELLDDKAARAVLDKHVPGMTDDAQIEMARAFTLRQLQQFAANDLTDEVLAKIDADLRALPAK